MQPIALTTLIRLYHDCNQTASCILSVAGIVEAQNKKPSGALATAITNERLLERSLEDLKTLLNDVQAHIETALPVLTNRAVSSAHTE